MAGTRFGECNYLLVMYISWYKKQPTKKVKYMRLVLIKLDLGCASHIAKTSTSLDLRHPL